MTLAIENNPASSVMAPVTNALSVGVSKVTFTNGSTALFWGSLTVPDRVMLAVWPRAVKTEKIIRMKNKYDFIGVRCINVLSSAGEQIVVVMKG